MSEQFYDGSKAIQPEPTPLSLDPRSVSPYVDALDVAGTPGKSALDAAQHAMKAMHESATAILTADAKLRPPVQYDTKGHPRSVYGVEMTPGPGGHIRSKLPPGQREEFERGVDAQMKRAGHAFDSGFAVVKEAHEKLTEQLKAAISDPKAQQNAALHSEVRAVLRGLSKSERTAALRNAVTAGDMPTIHAAFNASEVLTKMTDAERAAIRTLAERTLAPNLVAQRDANAGLFVTMQRASANYLGIYARMRGASTADKRAREALDGLAVMEAA